MSLLRRRAAAANPEARLVAAASRGDAAAFDQLRAQHEPAVTEFCAKMLEDRRAEAPGVAAETFAAARRELPIKDAQVELRPWLYALAFERCVARLDDERQTGSVRGQGEPHEQQRGAALMLGALPQAELVSLMSLAGSRPALFGLVTELGRSAPSFLGSLAVDQAAGQAVAALGVLPTLGSGGAEAAKHAAQMGPMMPASARAAGTGADSVWSGARIAAATAGVVAVTGAGAFALGDSIRSNGDRGGAAVQQGAAAGGQGARGSGMSISGGRGTAQTTGARGRDGTSSRDTRTAGSARAGRDGRDGTSGLAGRAGDSRAASTGLNGRDGAPGSSGSNASGGGGTGGAGTGGSGTGGAGTGGPGGLTPKERSLLKLDLEVGSIEAHVRVP